jgi:hypothetical protein
MASAPLSLSSLVLPVLGTGLAYVTYLALKFVFHRSPLRDLPGPPNPSLLFGQFRAISDAENSVLHEAWLADYGPAVTYQGLLGVRPATLHTPHTR